MLWQKAYNVLLSLIQKCLPWALNNHKNSIPPMSQKWHVHNLQNSPIVLRFWLFHFLLLHAAVFFSSDTSQRYDISNLILSHKLILNFELLDKIYCLVKISLFKATLIAKWKYKEWKPKCFGPFRFCGLSSKTIPLVNLKPSVQNSNMHLWKCLCMQASYGIWEDIFPHPPPPARFLLWDGKMLLL